MSGARNIPGQGVPPKDREALTEVLKRNCAEYVRACGNGRARANLSDFLLVDDEQGCGAGELFQKLRWGGVAVFASENQRQVAEAARQCAAGGFTIEEGPGFVRDRWAGVAWPLLSRKTHYFIARKTHLILPGQITERFTYDVQLVRHGDELSVVKQVPSFQSVVERLRRKFPDVAAEVAQRRARKFVDRIFPTFLTREAEMLYVLEEHVPYPYSRRLPRVLGVEKDEHGMVRKLRMTWLRNGGKPISHLEFAHQSADLLRVIHDIARVIHLDLRLDNFVITEHGVGFVDFGSAARVNEDMGGNPLLSSLFEELMQTSQIQRMLNQMTISGQVTSDVIRQSHQKMDKAVDFFFLAVQFNSPHSNPDLVDLIEFDPDSREAHELSGLTARILRPADPANPEFRSARDILNGIELIQARMQRG